MDEPRVVKCGDRWFRLPHENLVRPLTPAERSALRDDIVKSGRIEVAVIVYEDEEGNCNVCDGANRVTIAAEIGMRPDRIPLDVRRMTHEEAARKCREINANRRHMTPAEQAEARKARIPEVGKRAEEGMSTRKIAADLGVGKTTVDRDKKLLTVPPGTVSNSRKRPTAEQVAERRAKVKVLVGQGLSTAKIAELLGVTEYVVNGDRSHPSVVGDKKRPRGRPRGAGKSTTQARIDKAKSQLEELENTWKANGAHPVLNSPGRGDKGARHANSVPVHLCPNDPATLTDWIRRRLKDKDAGKRMTLADVRAWHAALGALCLELESTL